MSTGVPIIFRFGFAILIFASILGALFFTHTNTASATAGINERINFQGRLFNTQGASVADGYYNVQFKIYQDGTGQAVGNPGGSLKWTESYLNNNSQGVLVKNGYMSVELGSVTPFGNNVDWDQNTLWLSMNIGNKNTSCTPFTSCSPDGEMIPMKRLSATPYSLNSGRLGGLSSSQFVQIAQGVQADASNNTSSIFLDKTGTAGNFLQLQSNAVDVFSVSSTGNISLGANADHTLDIAQTDADTTGRNLSLAAGAGGTGSGSAGGTLLLKGGDGGGTNGDGGDIALETGSATGTGSEGTIRIGTARANTIQIGSTTISSGTQNISIGANNTAGSSTNVTIGSGGNSAAGTTTVRAKSGITIETNGITRASFDNTNSVYFGNGLTAAAPNNFSIKGTGSSTSGVSGGALTVQGGNATIGNTNGGDLTLSGGSGTGTGADGLVVLKTPTFSTTTNDPNCYPSGTPVSSDCTIALSSVNSSAAIMVGFSEGGKVATLPAPTKTTAGRVVYITAAAASSDFTIEVNGGGTGNKVAMRANTSATMFWNGSAWTAAGASSSTTLQSAYDNTLQSAGGAELVVSKTASTNGLTIRDSSENPVNGTLLSVQSSSAAGLLSVNSNVNEYSSNSGGETAGASSSTFPANTWSAQNGSTVSRYTTSGGYVASGQASVAVATSSTAGSGVANRLTESLTPNTSYNVSFSVRLESGNFTDLQAYYSADGTANSVACTTGEIVPTSIWTKINCAFVAPASGITSSNSFKISQTAGGTSRTLYLDNLSVTIAADFNYATDGTVNNTANFSTNWTAANGSSVSRSSSIGYEAGDSAEVITTGSTQGIRNKLRVNPLPETIYRISAYAASTTSGFDNFTIRYSPDGGTSFTDCADYNTQTISGSTATFTKINCYVTTTTATVTNPYVYFIQTDSTGRTYYVDKFLMTLTSNTTPNVQIGGGTSGGPTTLFTLDRAASAPIASDNDALLGSMYYDTTLGKLQCYEADGWGACGSSPDNIVTISPEYTNAVLHGTGVGTMTSDLCSDALDINDGSSSQPTICGSNETYNFYKWTSPQASPQTYSIYVTYQLPNTYKTFEPSSTSVMGRTDSTNSTLNYQLYKNSSTTGLTTCGSSVTVSTGSVSSWQTGLANGTSDPATCGFSPGDSIVFKINATASSNANAYAGNLNFTFSNR